MVWFGRNAKLHFGIVAAADYSPVAANINSNLMTCHHVSADQHVGAQVSYDVQF
jgi:hypothetical protein